MKPEKKVLEARNQISIRIIDDIRDFLQFRDEWITFAEKCGENNTVYLTHDWISVWWQHFGAQHKLYIVIMAKDGETVGIFPFLKAHYPGVFSGFQCLETIGAVNGNRVGLFRNEDADEVIEAFFNFIRVEMAANNTLLKLEVVPDDSKFYALFKEKAHSFSHKLVYKETTTTIAPYISLEKGWTEYYNRLTPAWRNRIGYILRHNDAAKRIAYQQFNRENLDVGLDRLFESHRKRWRSVNIKSPFENTDFCAYYRDIAATFAKNNSLHFSYITVDGESGSLLFCIIHNNKYYVMTVARNIQYARFELGHIHYWYVIQEAFQRELKEFDFLRGDEAYKFKWTDQFRNYRYVLIGGDRLLGRIYISYYYLLLRALQFVRNKHSIREVISLIRLHTTNNRLKSNLIKGGRNRGAKEKP